MHAASIAVSPESGLEHNRNIVWNEPLPDSQEFVEQVKLNSTNARLLEALPELSLPQCCLVAGCLFQTIWNLKSGNDPQYAIRDYDVFYFDRDDLSWEAEDRVIQRGKTLLGPITDKVEIRNQARVHLWYHEKFNAPYPALESVEDAIDRYLVACTRVGICVENSKVYAPDGFEDMREGILRMNPLNAQRNLFDKKCRSYKSRWPWLTVAE